MQNLNNSRQTKIVHILSTIKLFSLLIFSIIVYTEYLKYLQLNDRLAESTFSILPISIFLAIMLLVFQLWLIFVRADSDNLQRQKVIIEIGFMLLFAGLIIYEPHVYHYKLFFLFVITTSSIEFGLLHGFIISIISSLLVFFTDLISNPGVEINEHLQNDLVLIAVFILLAWLIGYYEKIEKEHREKITLLAVKDGLTDLYNHRYFYDFLRNKMGKSTRSLSLLFLDVDYFKRYNDLYGHQNGDMVLKKISKIIKETVGEKGLVARYGGEEFAVILPETDEETAVQIAEKIRLNIEKSNFIGEETQPGKSITVSIGVAVSSDNISIPEDLINSADDALYRAKFFNKNRVEVYNSILEDLEIHFSGGNASLTSPIKELINAINIKDKYTYGHTERVVIFSELMADELNLSEEKKRILTYGAYLHDIGKINIAEGILNKKTALSAIEWNILKQHPVHGVELIESFEGLRGVIPLILHHHERYDGNGYPDGLAGDEIPYLARILTIADSFDAMTSSRPYRPGRTFSEAVQELKKYSGKQFDQELVKVFINTIKKQNMLDEESRFYLEAVR